MSSNKSQNPPASAARRRDPLRIVVGVVVPIVVAVIGGLALIYSTIPNKCPSWPFCDGTPPVTETPTSVATSPPTDTSVPTNAVAETPTETPDPGPKAWISNLEGGTLVTQYIDLIGEYRADVTDDIWVFVHDPSDVFFAASMDPCNGQSAVKANGKWEVYFGVGIEQSSGPYELVVAVAPPAPSRFIADTLKKQCRENNFQSFPALPPGVEEVQRITVQRQPSTGPDDMYPAPPVFPDAGLPGQVSVAAFGTSGQVDMAETISGTRSDPTDNVWALVYTFYGRWYPQSIDACNNKHTEKIDDKNWRAKAIFGGESESDVGKPYYLVVVLASAETNSLLSNMQKGYCKDGNYPGFLTIELPDGLSVKHSSRVIRR